MFSSTAVGDDPVVDPVDEVFAVRPDNVSPTHITHRAAATSPHRNGCWCRRLETPTCDGVPALPKVEWELGGDTPKTVPPNAGTRSQASAGEQIHASVVNPVGVVVWARTRRKVERTFPHDTRCARMCVLFAPAGIDTVLAGANSTAESRK